RLSARAPSIGRSGLSCARVSRPARQSAQPAGDLDVLIVAGDPGNGAFIGDDDRDAEGCVITRHDLKHGDPMGLQAVPDLWLAGHNGGSSVESLFLLARFWLPWRVLRGLR